MVGSASPVVRPGRSLAAIESTGEVAKWALLVEEAAGAPLDGNPGSTDDAYLDPSNPISSRHLETMVSLFLDGHVKAFRPEKFRFDGYTIGGTASAPYGGYSCP
jgi:prepilin-type processing-associated H-X9-DG protein